MQILEPGPADGKFQVESMQHHLVVASVSGQTRDMPGIHNMRTMDLQEMLPRQFRQHFLERQANHFALQAIAGRVIDSTIVILHRYVGDVCQGDGLVAVIAGHSAGCR